MRANDTDSTRVVIRVEQGEWRKDRYGMLSSNLLELRRACWRAARPQGWLFPTGKARPPIARAFFYGRWRTFFGPDRRPLTRASS
jgi:hypothetical protein